MLHFEENDFGGQVDTLACAALLNAMELDGEETDEEMEVPSDPAVQEESEAIHLPEEWVYGFSQEKKGYLEACLKGTQMEMDQEVQEVKQTKDQTVITCSEMIDMEDESLSTQPEMDITKNHNKRGKQGRGKKERKNSNGAL